MSFMTKFWRHEAAPWLAVIQLFSGLDCREQGVVEPKTKIERGCLFVSEKQFAMGDQLVHRARYRAAERGSELDEPGSWRDETVVRKCQAIGFHELPEGGQDARDEDAVVRDSLGVEHDRVESLCIADKDVGSARRSRRPEKTVFRRSLGLFPLPDVKFYCKKT
jgi:hypothetical protein